MELGLRGKRIAMLATDGVHEAELTEPRRALDAAGAITELVAPTAGEIRSLKGAKKTDDRSLRGVTEEPAVGPAYPVDHAVADRTSADYAGLVLPGGSANVGALRGDAKAVQLVREFMAADKPVAAICDAVRLLIDADAVGGRTLTAPPELRADIEAAGGHWVDEPVHVDGRLITARRATDAPAFIDRLVRDFGNRIDERRVDELSEQSFPASDPPSMP